MSLFPIEKFAKNKKVVDRAKIIVRFVYIALALEVIGDVFRIGRFVDRGSSFQAVWSVKWIEYINFPTGVYVVFGLLFITSLWAAVNPSHRLTRIAAFVGVFEFHGFLSSLGQINHHWYPWIYVLFIFMFLPNLWDSENNSLEKTKKFILTFFVSQLTIMTTYTMSGIGKIKGAIEQWQMGEIHAFMPEALALHITSRLSYVEKSAMLADFFVDNIHLGWALMLFTIYLQAFSLWAGFKPSLHTIWAIGLVGFHIGTYLIMDIVYLGTIPLLLILFLPSPFKIEEDLSVKQKLKDIPLFGIAIMWIMKKLKVA